MNEEMLVKLANVETVEELNAILAENDMKLEEGVTAEQFLEALKDDGDELSADDLDAVAGGAVITWAMLCAAAALGITIAVYLRRHRNCGGGGSSGGGGSTRRS